MKFHWDEGNERHLARHSVSRIEAEQALADPLGQFLEETVVDGESRYRYVGATPRGRLLVIAFTMRDEMVRPITAFDAGRYTAQTYRRGGKL